MLGYRGLIESLAEGWARSPAARRVGAEFDDFVQVGFLAVIERQRAGIWPVSSTAIKRAMTDYMRDLRAQIALGPKRVEPGTEFPWGIEGDIVGFDEEQHST